MININNGEIKISNELIITPKYTFEQFKSTKYYNGQDGIRIIYLDEQQVINNRKYMVNLFFKNGILYMISLICCDVVFTENEEFRRKSLHDTIIKELGIEESKEFIWGKIISEYDTKSNVSSINIIYL